MMKEQIILLLAVFLPLAGAFILPLAGRISPRLRNSLALGFVLTSFACVAAIIPLVSSGKEILISSRFTSGFNFIFLADGLAVFMACVSSFISAIIVLYSFDYIEHYENRNEYYSMVSLFLGSMMGLIFSADLILLYIFWEMTAIASWRLVGFFREKTYVLRADKTFLVTVSGALIMLIGFISIYQQAGSFDLLILRQALKVNPLSHLAVFLILVGIFSKSATLPFHTWLPDAGVAPSPVTALLHAAVLVKIGVYVFARLFLATFTLEQFWHTAVPIIAATSAIVSAGAALVDTDLKRIIAYSTISQIGFIFFGLAIGNELAVTGALLYILMHGIAKAGLFLCAGIVEQNTKTKDITAMGGLITTMPVTAISFLFCAFSVMGIPPFGGFFSKYMIFAGAAQTEQLWLGGIFLTGAFLTIIYLFRVFYLVFLGHPQINTAKEAGRVMVFSVAILALLSFFGGILINYPAALVKTAVSQMSGVVK
ncbi:MAG: NADH-quinone oxidoreductase subunit L [Candidatus Omnitrophica bacterium]|nr:NADH-quinone oxidoreductase subunit L [Candidatus Omnitrophota bacterium]MDD5593086.1 NADH-quinone oxidoreductase subunit L [Candidatus Omnitrophota bacterium]